MHGVMALQWDQYGDEYLEEELHPLKILVIGCGGGGCNSINRLNRIGIEGAETIAINTDKRHLRTINADKRLLIGMEVTRGLGAGGNPDIGMHCVLNAAGALNQVLQGADLTFITVGMGGGTGTGTAPVIAEMAKRHGSLVISIATTPFGFEGNRTDVASRGLRRLDTNSDTLLILDNNRLLEMVPNLPMEQALGVMDLLISEIIKGLIEAITEPSLINLDFADLCNVLSQGGISTLLYGESSDPEGVVVDAFNNPLLDIDLSGATGALIHITGGNNLTLRRVEKIIKGISQYLDPRANLICGTRIDEAYEGQIRVMAVITGIADIAEDSTYEGEIEVDQGIEGALVRYDP
jgi:cell division protein FtsZ